MTFFVSVLSPGGICQMPPDIVVSGVSPFTLVHSATHALHPMHFVVS